MRSTLRLTLKKKWFDMIASGEKKEEYREIKPYWKTRLEGKDFQYVLFRNGYTKDCPEMLVELRLISVGTGRNDWGAEDGVKYYVISLGDVLINNSIG